MKNIFIIALLGFSITGCEASAINLSADIPKEQEVIISIETKKSND